MSLPTREDAQSLIEEYLSCPNSRIDELAEEFNYANRRNFTDAMRRKYHVHRERSYETVPVTSDFCMPLDVGLKEHIRISKEMDGLVAIHQETPQVINIHIDTKLPIALAESADWHYGQFGFDYDTFEKDVDTITNEPGLYVDIGGDTTHNIIEASKVGSSHNQIPIPVQIGVRVLALKQMIDKIMTLRTGNHDYWSTTLTGEDWLGEKARQLKIIYAKHGARINLKVGNQDYPYMARHIGRYNSSFNQTHTNKQSQRMDYPWARFTVFEHNHIADLETYWYDDRLCIAIRTGSYAIYDDRAQQYGYKGAHTSTPTVVMFPDKDKIVGFMEMEDAITYLRAVRGQYLLREQLEKERK